MASSTSCLSLTAWILFAVLLQILGLTLFVVGFFPIKPSLPGKSGPESYRMPTCNAAVDAEEVDLPPDQLRSMYEDLSGLPTSFDRLILMVIDGLPAEFVLGRGDLHPSKAMMEAMPYTQSLLSQGLAIAYHAKAAPPTVTMPRLKAMVSGAIGGFLDVAFNFNTQAFLDDNLLDQLYRVGWKLVMLGDETWIKLFPSLFSRQDGVSSFYVKDTVEVDYNVTRHLKVELAAIDWGLLILHYLGLDHVGHIGGRSSVLMASKLNEMDGIVKMIREQVLSQDVDRKTLLLVVSDHGMTESGNHGGSTHEETDSLALFIGLRPEQPHYAPSLHDKVLQVDIAPTLALLFGVPIPRNNVGVVLIDIFDTLTDEQKLRALELNSWQLLRLLQAHIPGLCYESFPDGAIDEHHVQINQSVLSDKEKFSQLYLKAMIAHNLWRSQQCSGLLSNSTHEMRLAVESYDDFLGNASEWLSHRATDKPIKLLVSGICIMFMSCVLLIHLFICLSEEVYSTLKQHSCQQKRHGSRWYSHEAFICFGVLAHIISLGASSMVEEEQYTWHFLASTLYLLFLFTIVHSLMCMQTSDSSNVVKGEDNVLHQFQRFANARNFIWFADFKTSERIKIRQLVQICSVVLILICGRILRGWHQGGINWIHLPDISKWLEQSGAFTIKLLQIASLVIVMIISSVALYLVRTNRKLVFRLFCSYFASGFLVLLYIVKNESHEVGPKGFYATLIAQIFYASIVVMVFFVLFALPWILPLLHCQETPKMIEPKSDSYSLDMHNKFHLLDNIRDATYLTGVTYCVCWCLLQLLLQQPVNAMPVALIFLQLLGSMVYFSADISPHRQLIEVAAIYFLGMAGHFGLGNSNSLATIDVAGAFIGISSHSTILSGILMFIITYASPLLSFLSVVIDTATKEIGRLPNQHKLELGCILRVMIGIPCLLPVVFNSILLTGFTITLLSMRNHLFVWSVFSPKYLYVCAETLSVYIGVCILASTGVYICSVFFYRTKMLR